MFGFFKAKEKWKVKVVNEFSSLHVGMAGEDYTTYVKAGTTGVAAIFKNGSVDITLDVKELPHGDPLVVHTKIDNPKFKDFELVEQIK